MESKRRRLLRIIERSRRRGDEGAIPAYWLFVRGIYGSDDGFWSMSSGDAPGRAMIPEMWFNDAIRPLGIGSVDYQNWLANVNAMIWTWVQADPLTRSRYTPGYEDDSGHGMGAGGGK